jgi:hypothetical protein
MRIYQFRISIIGIPKLYRTIEVSENCTFDDIHDAIFNAFDRYDHHLYSFFITRKDTTNIRSIYDAPEVTHPQNVEDIMGIGKRKKSTAKTRIGDVGLNENDVFHYLFDFGDDWWHRIRVQNLENLHHNIQTTMMIMMKIMNKKSRLTTQCKEPLETRGLWSWR